MYISILALILIIIQKGSTQGRRATKAERKKGAILKDLDWVDEEQKIKIGPQRAKLFKDQLKRDTQWLRTEKIMDYSLLVGIHRRDKVKKLYKSNNNILDVPNYDNVPNDNNIVLDHSENDTKFQPELQTVDEDIDEDKENDNDNDNDNDDNYHNMDNKIITQLSNITSISSDNNKEITPNPSITPFHPHSNIEEEEQQEQHDETNNDEQFKFSPTGNKNIATISSKLTPTDNDNNIKITITPTPQPQIIAEDKTLDVDNNNDHKNLTMMMIKPSTTDHTGTEDETDDDCRLSGSDIDGNIDKIRSQSADINNDPSELKYEEYEDDGLLTEDSINFVPNRRSSAPMIVSPKSDDKSNIDTTPKKKFKLFNFGSTSSSNTNVIDVKNTKSTHDKHVHSQSLQADSLQNVLTELTKPTKPKLHPSNSEKPSSKYGGNKLPPLKPLKMKSSFSTSQMDNNGGTNNNGSNNNKMYRGHISVKHPKRYKRKTAAEMQFAPEDIHIPAGIKHEVAEEKKSIKKFNKLNEKQGSHEITRSDTDNLILDDQEKDEKNDEKDNNNDSIGDNSLNDDEETNVDATMSGDICPWTTYHGGMVYEDEDGNIGNEVYFVGLIDILQKYNKRKKLENWIKKMKYDKNSISAAPPDLYAQRMCDFFEDKVV